MADRAELIESALDVYPEGLALLDKAGRVVFWNRAAEVLTGHCGAHLIGRELPQALEPLICWTAVERAEPQDDEQPGHGSLVHAQHQHGHDVPAISRRVILRDALGARIGTAAVFHAAEHKDALPHGDTSDDSEVRASQADLRDRVECEFEQIEKVPLGLMWIAVDQAEPMRKTHGARACEAMLECVERTLASHLRPGDEIGRWGNDEFLVLSHEGSGEVLANHAQMLAGIARTADFRWWGDRLTLTVSIGAAVAECGEGLNELFIRAQDAMEASAHVGGNHVTQAPGRVACSPL